MHGSRDSISPSIFQKESKHCKNVKIRRSRCSDPESPLTVKRKCCTHTNIWHSKSSSPECPPTKEEMLHARVEMIETPDSSSPKPFLREMKHCRHNTNDAPCTDSRAPSKTRGQVVLLTCEDITDAPDFGFSSHFLKNRQVNTAHLHTHGTPDAVLRSFCRKEK